MACLFGAVTVVTGPTVIIPMLRTVRPTAHLANILRWEGIVIDPVGALLAVLVFELIVSGLGVAAVGHVLNTFITILLVGLLLGGLAGYLLGQALRHHWLPDYLQNMATLTLVFGVFAFSNLLAEESGLLAVTVMGMWLANMRRVSLEGNHQLQGKPQHVADLGIVHHSRGAHADRPTADPRLGGCRGVPGHAVRRPAAQGHAVHLGFGSELAGASAAVLDRASRHRGGSGLRPVRLAPGGAGERSRPSCWCR